LSAVKSYVMASTVLMAISVLIISAVWLYSIVGLVDPASFILKKIRWSADWRHCGGFYGGLSSGLNNRIK
ncbi:hypothetical protein, partial [uncultured Oceanicoccus sp.]|uniref:hypothetical protein n=1 Tax=uncultured Oceanicoccus sp. TaxID=1706381 RepID=UPI0030D804BB